MISHANSYFYKLYLLALVSGPLRKTIINSLLTAKLVQVWKSDIRQHRTKLAEITRTVTGNESILAFKIKQQLKAEMYLQCS